VQQLNLPKMGQGMEEGTVVEWHVEEGDRVSAGDPVVDVESEKTVSEIAADRDGVFTGRLVDEGETVPVGTELGFVRGEDEDGQPPAESVVEGTATPAADDVEEQAGSGGEPPDPSQVAADESSAHVRATPSARRRAREHDVSIADVAGRLGIDHVTPEDVERFTEPSGGQPKQSDGQPEPSGRPQPSRETDSEVLGSPWARVVAEERDVTIEAVGTALDTDRVRAADVEEYVETGLAADAATEADEAAAEPPAAAATESSSAPAVRSEEPLVGAAARMFERMGEVNDTYASTTTVARVDVTELYDLYERLSSAWSGGDGEALSITAFVVRAVGQTLPDYGPLNAEVVDEDAMRIYDDVNVGIAVDTDSGLLVPTIYDADELSVRRVSNEISRLASAAASRSLDYDEMQNGTFTISNAGSLGAYINTPQINPPQTAILSMCKIFEEPAVVDGAVVPRKMMHLSLTYDHRVVEGATAVEFLQAVKSRLEEPESLLS